MDFLRNLFGKKQSATPQKKDLPVTGGHVEKRVVDRLVSMLRDPISGCRNAAMEALGAIGDERAVQPLISSLRSENQGIVGNFSEGFKALAAIGTPDAINFLESFLRDKGVSTLNRREASEVLKERRRRKRPTPPKAIEEFMADLQKEAAREAATRGRPELLATLQETSQDTRLRFKSAMAITALGDAATESVLPLLRHDDPDTREHAAWILGKVRDKSAVDPLIAVLQDDLHADVVSAAAHALGKMGEARAVDPLIQGLGADDADTRTACAAGLILLGVIAVEPLLSALSSSDWKTKLGAIYAFRGWPETPPLRDPRATDELIRIVGDSREHQYVVATACQALGAIGDRRVIGALAGRLRDNDAIIREHAARALAEHVKLYQQATSKPEER